MIPAESHVMQTKIKKKQKTKISRQLPLLTTKKFWIGWKSIKRRGEKGRQCTGDNAKSV